MRHWNCRTPWRGFRTELADVTEQVSGDLHLEIGDFLHFADFFFDGLIADWMVHDKIAESYDRAAKDLWPDSARLKPAFTDAADAER